MFGGNLWGAIAPGGDQLLDKERNPPAKPVPIEFPSYVPPRSDDPLDRQHLESLCKAVTSVRKPSDVKDVHLAQFNIQLEQDVQLTDMIPDDRFKSRPLLYDADLTAMLKELDFDNHDAYREVLRLPPLEGRSKARLAYSRNFYASLEDMCRYWDDSKDNYYEVEAAASATSAAEPAEASSTRKENETSKGADAGMKDAAGDGVEELDFEKVTKEFSASSTPPNLDTIEIPARPKMKQVYKGLRLGNGEQMSPGTRIAAVRSLLKMAVHKFNCRDYDVHPREKFRIGNINLPSTFYNFCVARMPSDVKLARARMIEGPLLGVHSRMEVRFKPTDGLFEPTSDFVGEKYDLFREVSGLLMLAKQRAREGQTPSKEPSTEHWWVVKHRWGGGPTKWGQLASEVFEDDDPSWSPEERRLQLEKREKGEQEGKRTEGAATTDLNNLKPEDLISTASSLTSERPKKKKKADEDGKDRSEYKDGRRLMYTPPLRRKWYQEWTKIRPNSSTWDDKIIFKRIGIPNPEQGWDDVYMLSAANHHVCIVKLSVHENYLEWLETGKVKQQKASTSERQDRILYMSRSRWFDLFDIEQRKELLTGVWRLLSWINRNEVPKADLDKMEEMKKQQQEGDGEGDHVMEV
nr:hypothetical protein LTR18_008106 [Exophiala xenobiotica]